jgi:hypothetical protein
MRCRLTSIVNIGHRNLARISTDSTLAKVTCRSSDRLVTRYFVTRLVTQCRVPGDAGFVPLSACAGGIHATGVSYPE